ncbi:MAG: beta-lactamase family protein [Muribaculaceae bacterium]|nr:beta-lactamase family protein [Muribaculaceae bacterium]
MKPSLFTKLIITFCAISSLCSCAGSKPAEEDKSLPRAETPAVLAESMDSLWTRAAEEGVELHSVMVVLGDSIIYEHWDNGSHPDSLHFLYSVSKTFTSLGVGLAINDRLLTLDERIVDIFPDCLPDSVSDNLAAMTVENLLTMSSGHAHAPALYTAIAEKEDNDSTTCWAREFLSYPVEYAPGTVFSYNSMGSFMLSAAVQRRTGEKLIDYLTPRLFEPLGIEGAVWEENPEGINTGGWGLWLKTEDLAKVGKLLLDKGQWHGKQIIPAGWVETMSARHVGSVQGTPNSEEAVPSEEDLLKSDWVQGYGYQVWRCRHNAFRADGSLGQFIVVIPEVDAVVAMTANSHTYQQQMNLIWDYILPFLEREKQKNM